MTLKMAAKEAISSLVLSLFLTHFFFCWAFPRLHFGRKGF